jgi:outer membrane lipoprotein-sorting protein
MRLLLLSLLLFQTLVCVAAELPAEIETCMKRNLPESTLAQSIELRAIDRSHYESVMQANVFLKRNADDRYSVMMHFSEPADVRGARFLIVQNEPQNDMYIYMPGLFKVRRITSKNISSSVMGTDFSYEDFERLHGVLTNMRSEQQPDEMLRGRPVYVLASYPAEDSGYETITSYIDKESCITLKTDLYGNNGQLRKQLTVDPSSLKKTAGIWYPSELLMKDFRDKTETRLKIEKLAHGIPLPDSLFDHSQLKQAEIPDISP